MKSKGVLYVAIAVGMLTLAGTVGTAAAEYRDVPLGVVESHRYSFAEYGIEQFGSVADGAYDEFNSAHKLRGITQVISRRDEGRLVIYNDEGVSIFAGFRQWNKYRRFAPPKFLREHSKVSHSRYYASSANRYYRYHRGSTRLRR